MADGSNEKIFRNRLSTDEIYERVVVEADEEMHRSIRELFFSALAGGFAISITFLLYTSGTHATDGIPLLGAILYPLGFIYIIIGNYQLYTENTLPPVALILDRVASIPAMLRMYAIVLLGNLAGGTVGALVLAHGGVFDAATAQTATDIALSGLETDWWALFFKAAFAGLIVAGVVWMDFSVNNDMARITLIYMAFLAIPLAGLFHIVVAATEVMFLVFTGVAGLWTGITQFVVPVLLGNTVGGILLVTVVNYLQTSDKIHGFDGQLSLKEWVLTVNKGTLEASELLAELERRIDH